MLNTIFLISIGVLSGIIAKKITKANRKDNEIVIKEHNDHINAKIKNMKIDKNELKKWEWY